MNWEIIISAIVGMLTGGGVSWLFKLKEDKASSQADVVDSRGKYVKTNVI